MEENYNKYLRSSEWKEKRRMLLETRGRFCEKCGKGPNVLLDIHHLTYKRIFNEKPEDLMILCRGCHEKVHKKKFSKKKKSKKPKRVFHLLQETDSKVNNFKPKKTPPRSRKQKQADRINKMVSKLSLRDKELNRRYNSRQ